MNVSELNKFLKKELKDLDADEIDWADILPNGWHKFILELYVAIEKFKVASIDIKISDGVLYVGETGCPVYRRKRLRVSNGPVVANPPAVAPTAPNITNPTPPPAPKRPQMEYRKGNDAKLFKRICESIATESTKTCMVCGNFARRRKELENKPALCANHHLNYINNDEINV